MSKVTKWIVRSIGLLGFAITCGGAGFFIGAQQSFNGMLDIMRTTLAGETLMNAFTLAELRLDEPAKGVESLERRLDTGAINLMYPLEIEHKTFDDLSDSAKRALYAVKIYRTAYPSHGKKTDQELLKTLNKIPMPDKWDSSCNNGMSRLYVALQSGATTQSTTQAASSQPAISR